MKKLKLNSEEKNFLAILYNNSKERFTDEYLKKEADYWKVDNYVDIINSLIDKSALEKTNGDLVFTKAGFNEAEKCYNEFQKKNFDENFLIHYNSKTFRKFCKEVNGIEMFLFSMLNKIQIESLEEAAGFNNTDKVLDIGCGAGDLVEYLHDKYNFHAVGIDFAPKTIKLANDRVKNKKDIKYLEMDIRELSELKEKFTKIIAVDSLYFHKDIRKTLKDIFELLEEGGSVFIFYTEMINSGKEKFRAILNNLNIKYQKIDFTVEEKNLWINTKVAAEKYKNDFERENNLSIYEGRISESEEVMRMEYERFLYIIRK
ncbi:MAG: Ubiquinone biosynthesis O-methyltransferase [Ignavibacteria bacterium]|nr:Ubiquinone biosynthesis O-methyltransferase [Ignavibacteria bacterium]